MNEISFDGSGELWISDISDARCEDKSQFDRVITVCQESIEDNVSDKLEYDWFNMSDGDDGYGGDCSYTIFEVAADTLYDALSNGETVLIHCHMGRSRSTTVSMAALGRLCDLRPHEAYGLVRRYRIQTNPNDMLYDHMSEYINKYD